jgi:hypothetical protein
LRRKTGVQRCVAVRLEHIPQTGLILKVRFKDGETKLDLLDKRVVTVSEQESSNVDEKNRVPGSKSRKSVVDGLSIRFSFGRWRDFDFARNGFFVSWNDASLR